MSGVVTRCAVVGAGAWGTALADLLASGRRETWLWAFEADVVQQIEREHRNERYLNGFDLEPTLRATQDIEEAVRGADLVVFAPPSPHLRGIARAASQAVGERAVLAVASKGIDRDTLALMTDVAADEIGGRAVVAISGPSFAAEVAARQPTAIVAASDDAAAAADVQEALSGPEFRVYTTGDVTGVELGGALKNVMAVATGICEGLGLGFNSRAALITRGLAEMTRLGLALGAQAATFAGLAGMGDLVLTCTGALSRNRAVGLDIGRGATLGEALAGKETVAEGVNTARSALALAERHGVDMPIVRMVNEVLFEERPARDAIGALMTRGLRAEQDA